MKLIIEMTHPPGGDVVLNRVTEKLPLRIGRAFDNDIIVHDIYVSAHHAQIEHDGTALVLRDLRSDNGITLNHRAVDVVAKLHSGDRFILGHTELSVFDPHHPVPAAEKIEKSGAISQRLSRPAFTWPLFLLTLAFVAGWTYLQVWTEDIGEALSIAVGSAMGIILVWAGLWSAAGRLIRHKSRFAAHIALACLYMIASGLFFYVQSYISFLSNDGSIATAVNYFLNLILIAPLLYGCLTLATDMTKKRRKIASLYFSVGIMAGIFLFGFVSEKSFTQEPVYPATLEPYLSFLAPYKSVDGFTAQNAKIFKSSEFAQEKKPGAK